MMSRSGMGGKKKRNRMISSERKSSRNNKSVGLYASGYNMNQINSAKGINNNNYNDQQPGHADYSIKGNFFTP